MELLDGMTLQMLVERYGPQPERRVVNILKQVCGSLIEAHAAGLIHRDIKPANIMINRRGGIYDFVKLLDFGLVKALDGPRQSSYTVSPGLTGTPLYMSPEAIEKGWTVDARSDIYALGAVGYFLLTGKPVFEGDNIVEICLRHIDTPPVPPSVRLRQPISADLESLI
jgi:eukaryotic-like serine/threonine-protein kinase